MHKLSFKTRYGGWGKSILSGFKERRHAIWGYKRTQLLARRLRHVYNNLTTVCDPIAKDIANKTANVQLRNNTKTRMNNEVDTTVMPTIGKKPAGGMDKSVHDTSGSGMNMSDSTDQYEEHISACFDKMMAKYARKDRDDIKGFINIACQKIVYSIMNKECPDYIDLFEDDMDASSVMGLFMNYMPRDDAEQAETCMKGSSIESTDSSVAEICGLRRVAQILDERDDINMKIAPDIRKDLSNNVEQWKAHNSELHKHSILVIN